MGNNLCIIDDAFMAPAINCELEQYGSYTGAGLATLLAQSNWGVDQVVCDLCRRAFDDKDEQNAVRWNLRAFSSPEHFFNAFDAEQYRSDIIIFDWEYQYEIDQVECLNRILSQSYSFILIYSQQEVEDIQKIISEGLSEYQHRIKIIDKDPNESYSDLLETARDKQENNFAFKFGQELRHITIKSLENVLHALSQMDFDRVLRCLLSNHDCGDIDAADSEIKQIISAKLKDALKESPELHQFLADKNIPVDVANELLELSAENIKNNIISSDTFVESPVSKPDPGENALLFQELWSYRLYHIPRKEDQVVRTGDLIKNRDEDVKKLYFVLNADCNLQRFWKTCGGQLVLVELLDIPANTDYIKERVAEVAEINSKLRGKFKKISSLTNVESLKAIPGAPVLLPFVPIEKNNLRNFMLFPLQVISCRISVPKGDSDEANDIKKIADICLDYKHTQYERICSVSEPFVGSLKWAILSQLYGWGSPDYPDSLQCKLAEDIKGLFQ